MLNHLWFGFFAVATISALIQWLGGDAAVFGRMVEATFAMAKMSVEIAIGLIGLLAFWMGLFKVAEAAGIITRLAALLEPLLARLMPEVPRGHPAFGSITLNFAANIFGLDNAATPAGLKAMQDLQSLNPSKDTASNAQIMFLVLNASSLTLLPVTIFMYRAQMGSPDPTSVFIPILLATSASTFFGWLSVAIIQRLPVWNRVVGGYVLGFVAVIGGLMWYFSQLPPTERIAQSSLLGHIVLWGTIISFLAIAWCKKIPLYERFIEGAKEGFGTAITIIPYLVAMLVGVGVLRASGALEALLSVIRRIVTSFGGDTAFVDALPTALIKPFSGSGARASMLETMQTHGVDSFAAKLAATIQGSTETTFYVVAVYFGAVGIVRVRHAVGCALLADLAGVLAAIAIAYWLF